MENKKFLRWTKSYGISTEIRQYCSTGAVMLVVAFSPWWWTVPLTTLVPNQTNQHTINQIIASKTIVFTLLKNLQQILEKSEGMKGSSKHTSNGDFPSPTDTREQETSQNTIKRIIIVLFSYLMITIFEVSVRFRHFDSIGMLCIEGIWFQCASSSRLVLMRSVGPGCCEEASCATTSVVCFCCRGSVRLPSAYQIESRVTHLFCPFPHGKCSSDQVQICIWSFSCRVYNRTLVN